MKEINELSIRDILPSSLCDKKLLTISDGIDKILKRINEKMDKCYIYKNLANNYPEVIDELFWEWHVDYYSEDLPLDKKIKLIRNSYVNHLRKGTPWAVENMLNDVLERYSLLEWFEYGGKPYHFKIITDKEFDEIDSIEKINKIVNITKNARSHFEGLSHYKKIEGSQNYSYAHFLSDSMEFVQDVRKFREIKNETNYSYSTMVSDSVEYRQERI
ncbi:MAG: phage tail protein [Clostridium butyricum]